MNSPNRTALSVNVNKVALVRNTRHLGIPSVTRAATLCLQAGAHGITVHPRPDERHIRAQDVRDLHGLMQVWPQAEFNIEGNPFHNLMDFVRELRPQIDAFLKQDRDERSEYPRTLRGLVDLVLAAEAYRTRAAAAARTHAPAPASAAARR